jgi:hypothetical protein
MRAYKRIQVFALRQRLAVPLASKDCLPRRDLRHEGPESRDWRRDGSGSKGQDAALDEARVGHQGCACLHVGMRKVGSECAHRNERIWRTDKLLQRGGGEEGRRGGGVYQSFYKPS